MRRQQLLRKGGIPLPPTSGRNHSVFDADQCADLQNAIQSRWARLVRSAVSCGFPAARDEGVEELRSRGKAQQSCRIMRGRLALECAGPRRLR